MVDTKFNFRRFNVEVDEFSRENSNTTFISFDVNTTR